MITLVPASFTRVRRSSGRSSLEVGLRGSKPRETEAAHEKSLARRVIRVSIQRSSKPRREVNRGGEVVTLQDFIHMHKS